MNSYLRYWNPTPGFPEYSGPYKVGTIDVEIPVDQLDSPVPTPDESITTVQFRMFYPCEPDAKPTRPVNWLPAPQREHVSAYSRFLGAGTIAAEIISFFPRLLHYIQIPAMKNAPLLQPTTESGRWPVMIFSHGLGGNRNAYSHLAGSVASHGMVVLTPEHRDGSAPISYIRDIPSDDILKEKSVFRRPKRVVHYERISHTPGPEVEAGRHAQLKIRLWEMGLVHDALMKINEGSHFSNLNFYSASLLPFANKLAVLEPGSITFAGHSFGGATVAQFVKSVFYAPETHNAPPEYESLFSPYSRSAISKQITPNTPVVLLDVWCMPLRNANTRWLWNKPMPCYAPGGPGGCALLAVESQAFFKWRVHLKATKRFLSPDPSNVSHNVEEDGRPGPHFYYPSNSAHLSQSDFGILFPRLTRSLFKCEEPLRILKLNVRAILQLLRERNIPVSATSPADMELDSETDSDTKDDIHIFGTVGEDEGGIRGWHHLNTDVRDLTDVELEEEDSKVDEEADPTEAVMGGELMKHANGTQEQLETSGSELETTSIESVE